MSDYVNKINSAGKEYDIRDSRVEGLEAAIAGKADASSVEEIYTSAEKEKLAGIKPVITADGMLFVDKITDTNLPPVTTIDGVTYYHKCEIDLAKLEHVYSFTSYDVFTGELVNKDVSGYCNGAITLAPWGSMALTLTGNDIDVNNGISILLSNGYVSRSFEVVDDGHEVTSDNGTIYFQRGDIAYYYGQLSDDGDTFTSYWTLKSEKLAPITKITDGAIELAIRDSRVDGMVTGTTLYKHELTLTNNTTTNTFSIISTNGIKATNLVEAGKVIESRISFSSGSSGIYYYYISYGGNAIYCKYFNYESSTSGSISFSSVIADRVTVL